MSLQQCEPNKFSVVMLISLLIYMNSCISDLHFKIRWDGGNLGQLLRYSDHDIAQKQYPGQAESFSIVFTPQRICSLSAYAGESN